MFDRVSASQGEGMRTIVITRIIIKKILIDRPGQPSPVGFAQLLLEYFTRRIARQIGQEIDGLWGFETGNTRAAILDDGRRQRDTDL